MSDLQMALDKINEQGDLYDTFDKYYSGDHALNYASDKFKMKFGKRLNHLRDNLCKTVINAPASRLEIIAFGADAGEIGEAAWKIWKRNLMPLRAKETHREAFKSGDAYVIVWHDPNDETKARIYTQPETANCALWRNEETGVSEFGAKCWIGNDKRMYLTLYYPDRIEKYISKNEVNEGSAITNDKEFEERVVIGESFPLYHDLKRVPMIHFTNGESLLTDVVPLQAALNKSLADLFVGMEYNSLRQRWTSGISYPIDEETGKAMIPFEDGEQYATTKSDTAKFGEFSDMNLTETLSVANDMRSSIARVSGIPMHYFQITKGDFPSGEAQRKAESRFIEIIQEAQISFGESWSQVMSIALQIEGKGDQLIIEPQWNAAAPVDQREELENGIMKKQLGWTNKKIQQDFGLDEKTIKEMGVETAAQATAMGETLGAAFDRGEIA